MRSPARLVLACAIASVAAVGIPSASAYDPTKGPVTIEQQGPVECVRFPCPQPTPVVVCVVSLSLCTPR